MSKQYSISFDNSSSVQTYSKLYFKDSRDLSIIPSTSVDLMITSPPYPMIQIWDELFISLNPDIQPLLINEHKGVEAFELMHQELDKVWLEVIRVLKPGGIACINIGDATRTINKVFQLFPNHYRITQTFFNQSMLVLPEILWRKQTNAPNKFMGSGMLPPGAYVTYEHEYILIFRKGDKRCFLTKAEKDLRRKSGYFWEERNQWFSDVWDFKGTRQALNHNQIRKRSSAFPFELAYRLINMFSIQGDYVLDPFLGTGTSLLAAVANARNFIGVEIDPGFRPFILNSLSDSINTLNFYIDNRIQNHLSFVHQYENEKAALPYIHNRYSFPVRTKQEIDITLYSIDKITIDEENAEMMISYLDYDGEDKKKS